eukprot:7234505-Pyramimonas_sp.AAC.1
MIGIAPCSTSRNRNSARINRRSACDSFATISQEARAIRSRLLHKKCVTLFSSDALFVPPARRRDKRARRLRTSQSRNESGNIPAVRANRAVRAGMYPPCEPIAQ